MPIAAPHKARNASGCAFAQAEASRRIGPNNGALVRSSRLPILMVSKSSPGVYQLIVPMKPVNDTDATRASPLSLMLADRRHSVI